MEQLDDSTFKQHVSVALEENIEMTRETLVLIKQIHRYMRFAKISAMIQLLLIIAPFILGALFLPSLIKGITELTGSLPIQGIQNSENGEEVPVKYDINSLIKQYQQSQQQR